MRPVQGVSWSVIYVVADILSANGRSDSVAFAGNSNGRRGIDDQVCESNVTIALDRDSDP
jgi:hypothetical protein